MKGRDAAKEERKTVLSKIQAAKKVLNKGIAVNKKKIFGEDDEAVQIIQTFLFLFQISNLPEDSAEPAKGLNIHEAIAEMKTMDKEDRKQLKEKKRRLRDKQIRKKAKGDA